MYAGIHAAHLPKASHHMLQCNSSARLAVFQNLNRSLGIAQQHRVCYSPPSRTITAMAARTAMDEVNKGAFVRTDAGFRHTIEPGGRFEPEADRYHLYISYACPWASRCLAYRNLKGLEHVIGLSVVHPTMQRTRPDADEHIGWAFKAPGDPALSSPTGHGQFECDEGCIPDSVNGAHFIRDLYDKAGDTTGKYSVPVLWDKKLNTIVNNESSEIIRMFNAQFNHLAKNPDLDLYPEALREKIDEINSWVYPGLNNGVYRCGFATLQAPYEAAFKELTETLDRMESILSKQRFLAGDVLTEADVRAFVTLIRYDEVYVVHFKTNTKQIREYENLREYTKDVYQTPGIATSVNMQHIKVHYYSSHAINKYAIVPVGMAFGAWWEQPHNRAEKFSSK